MLASKGSPQPTMIAVSACADSWSWRNDVTLYPSGKKSSAAYSIRWSSRMRRWISGKTSPSVSHVSGRWMMKAAPRLASVLR